MIVLSFVSIPIVADDSTITMFLKTVVTVIFLSAEVDGPILFTQKKEALYTSQDSSSQDQQGWQSTVIEVRNTAEVQLTLKGCAEFWTHCATRLYGIR